MGLAKWFNDNFGISDPYGFGEVQRAVDRYEREKSIETSSLPKPRLASVRFAPSREDFDAWRDQPVTKFVFAAMRHAQSAQQEMWLETSWGSGTADPVALAELRARADAYAALEEGGYEAFCEWAGVEPDNA